MRDNKNDIKTWIIVLIVILVLIYLSTLGKVNFLTEGDISKKTKLGEKKIILENRFKRVQDVLNKKKSLKRKLEKICKRVLICVRLGLVLLLVGGIFVAHSYFQFTLLELVEYFGLAAIVILLIGFIVIGSPANF